MPEPSAEHDLIAREVVDCAFAVHSHLGPGLLESVYHQCLTHELEKRNFAVQKQVNIPIVYRDLRLEGGFRIDLIGGNLVVVEIKAVERLLPLHELQTLTYLKLSGYQLGLLINFNVAMIKYGIKRIILKN